MKRALFLIQLMLYVSLGYAQTSKYIPFPSNMIVYSYMSRANSDAGWYSASRMEIYGDTLLKGKKYSKCYVAESNQWGMNNSMPTTDLKALNKVIGGIREEITYKKVYFYSFNTNQEELLYDFDLHLGDTLFKNDGYRFYHSLLTEERLPVIDTVWVSRIDSVLMPHDGRYHKRFNFEKKFKYQDKDTIISSDSVFKVNHFDIKISPLIEGIGVDFDPVTQINEFEHHFNEYLFCRTIDGNDAYNGTPPMFSFMSKANCKSIVSGIGEEERKNDLIVYPNPSDGRLNLITPTSDFISFEIFNCLGVKIQDRLIDKREIAIDLSEQPTGIYFIKVCNKKGKFEVKKISIN